MGYVSITSAIVSVLNGVSGIEVVYNHEPKELKQYPAATVTALSHANVFEDLAANKRVYQHKIILYYRTDVAADAESILQALADAVITAIEHDTTLGSTVDIANPSTGKWAYQQRELPVRLVEITISSMQRVVR